MSSPAVVSSALVFHDSGPRWLVPISQLTIRNCPRLKLTYGDCRFSTNSSSGLTCLIKVILRPTFSRPWCQAPIRGGGGAWPRHYCHTVADLLMWRPLSREDESVVCNWYWASPMQSWLGPSAAGIITLFYCFTFEIHPIWRANFLYLFLPVILRLTVSRPVCLGIRHPSGDRDQIFISVRHLRVS
jgi:hypothetical protein